MIKRILRWKEVGNGRTGTPSIRWPDDVCKDMKVIKVKNWKEFVKLMEKAGKKRQLTQRYVAFQTAVLLNC